MFRTGYSFRHAVGHLPAVIDRIKSIGLDTAPIADRLSTFAYNRWTKAAKKAGLRPVYGVEIAVTPTLGESSPTLDHWTFLAIDDIGAINELIWAATSNPGREPSLLMETALHFPGVVKIAAERLQLDTLPTELPQGFYLGLSPATPKGLAREAVKRQIPLLAMSANVYPNPEDREFYRVLLGKNAGSQTYPQHILSDAEWHTAVEDAVPEFAERDAAVRARNVVLSVCKAQLKKAQLLIPEKPKTLRQMCIDGAPILGIDLSQQIYSERLDRELKLIEEKKFEDYFYIIADMVAWAKKRMVCGPARGSSCGSLVCYLLGITAIDPLPYGLLFERFIDTTRSDLPDIDLDFSDVRRQLVFDYVEQKYGEDRVARLGTVGTYMPRSALHQTGIALRIPRWQVEKVLENIVVRSSGDSRALQQLEDTLKDTEAGRSLLNDHPQVAIAGRMEGHPNVSSQHAAGIVVTEGAVRDVVAIDARTKSTMCDKKDAEDLNLLKIDALGLTQLSIFERTLQLIGKPDVSGFLETLPLDDVAAFGVLNKGHFSGIFQFMGGALQSLAKQTNFTHINELVAITALARPGPMSSGGANAWVKRKRGLEPVSYPHELLKPYLEDTLGVVVYQEQVMQIGREIGDLTWEQVTALRKAMSKSLGEEFFNQFGDPWKRAAIAKGMPAEIADAFWKDLCAFGAWGFNKSHAVAYGTVSYWCCWLKAHHPVEFAAATLDAESDPVKQIALLRELATEGIGYVPIDHGFSAEKWEPKTQPDGSRILVGPLTNVKGIGPGAVRTILNARKNGTTLPAGIGKKLANARTGIDTLYPIRDRVAQLYPDLATLNIVSAPTNVIDVQPIAGTRREVLIIAVAQRIVPRDRNEVISLSKRGGKKWRGQSKYLNLFARDDSDEVFCMLDTALWERKAAPIVERGRPGKALYAIKGTVPGDFRMIYVTNIRYIGDLEEDADGQVV